MRGVRLRVATLLALVLGAVQISTASADPGTAPAEEATTIVARGFTAPHHRIYLQE